MWCKGNTAENTVTNGMKKLSRAKPPAPTMRFRGFVLSALIPFVTVFSAVFSFTAWASLKPAQEFQG